MWISRKGQYIVNQLMKDFNLPKEKIGGLIFSLTDEKLHVYEERYYKYLMKHIHPKTGGFFCSAPEYDTRCECAKCWAKYSTEKPEGTMKNIFDKIINKKTKDKP